MTPERRIELLGACARGKVRQTPKGNIVRESDKISGFPRSVHKEIGELLDEGAVYLDEHNFYRPTGKEV